MQKIFYNGTIITMEQELYACAVLINNDIIEKIGDFNELLNIAPNAEFFDLNKRTMLPAFIDAHGHFSSYANSKLQISLDESASFDEIREKIEFFINSNNIKENEWIIAKGYDQNTLIEKSHPDNKFLDKISEKNPIVLQHKSLHCGIFNSKALEVLGITMETKSPSGGIIGKTNHNLTGYMEEDAFIKYIKKVPMSDFSDMLDAYYKAQEKYLSCGITTVQEGMMVNEMLPIYEYLLNLNMLIVDVVGYPDISSMKNISSSFISSFKKYDRHFKIGGYKIFLDGSPQLKTAWMKSPYKNSNNNINNFFGYGTMNDLDVFFAVKKAADDNIQILAHCNGDAAISQYINAVKRVAKTNKNILKLRPVIIHSQLITKEQLEEISKLNMIPSFFIAHIFHFGDIHIENFGFDRARYISPANTALKNNIIFTFHQDSPVTEPDMLETISIAVTRKTKKGILLSEDECISVIDALKAVTINAAYQYFEEDKKGSIKEGKQADFVILSDNPLTVSPSKIKNISVTDTIKDGNTVFHLKHQTNHN